MSGEEFTPAACKAAVKRIIEFADELEASAAEGGPASIVAQAIATEIRARLRGQQ